MQFIKNHAAGFIVGVCVVITGLAVYQVYNLSGRVAMLENVVGQIVQLINNSQKTTTTPAK